MLSLGLDLGTTTVSAVVVDTNEKSVLVSRTCKSYAQIPSDVPGEKCQDPKVLTDLAEGLLEELLEAYPGIEAIGITGQMHGILYLDREGNCISPLYTWQDQRSAAICPQLSAATGYRIAPGYGLATHCALMQTGTLPEDADKLCTIMDYLAFRLCGKRKLWIHATNAASLGLFSLETGAFDEETLAAVGIDPALLPAVTWDTAIQGYFRGIPVAVAIGDNQASFLGSVVDPENAALVNFGTGSQISRMVKSLPESWQDDQVEIRPYLDGAYLLCGSALCGGRAYALVERFFRRFLEAWGEDTDSCYAVLNKLAQKGLTQADGPRVETTFCGTRWDPEKRGGIYDLSEENFTPEALAAGTLMGMARELQQLLERMPGMPVKSLAASGNAVRKNPALLQAVNRTFGVETGVPACAEEAAFGAACFGKVAAEAACQ